MSTEIRETDKFRLAMGPLEMAKLRQKKRNGKAEGTGLSLANTYQVPAPIEGCGFKVANSNI